MATEKTNTDYKDQVAHFTRIFCLAVIGISEFRNLLISEVQSQNWSRIIDEASNDMSQPSFLAFLDYLDGALNECHINFQREKEDLEPNRKEIPTKEYLDVLAHIYNDIAAISNPYFRTQLNRDVPYIRDFGGFNEFLVPGSHSLQVKTEMSDDRIDPISFKYDIDRIRQLKILGVIDNLRKTVPNGDSAIAKVLYPILETMNPESIRKALDQVDLEAGTNHQKWRHLRSHLIAIGAVDEHLMQ